MNSETETARGAPGSARLGYRQVRRESDPIFEKPKKHESITSGAVRLGILITEHKRALLKGEE